MAEDWRSDLEVWLAPFLWALRHKTRMRVTVVPASPVPLTVCAALLVSPPVELIATVGAIGSRL